MGRLPGVKKPLDSYGGPAKVEASGGGDADDDFDLFGSDEEDEEMDAVRQQRLQAYAEKKSKSEWQSG